MKKGLAMAPAPIMTVDEYLAMPESTVPQELAYGIWRVADAPSPRHQSAVFAFALALNRLARRDRVGRVYVAPVDVVLDRRLHVVVQPDLVLITRPRLNIVRDRIWGAPDLVLEVLSPRPRVGELSERLSWFAEYGVTECWLLHQDHRTLEVVEFTSRTIADRRSYRSQEPIRSPLLPGWHESLDAVLADDDEA